MNYLSDAEIWKPIPGYDGLYEASSLGRIRTAEGKTTSSARFERRVWQQRIMKQKWRNRRNSPKADARVCLWKDGKEKTHLVSRLVAMAFLPAPYDKLTVNHIDGNPQNNCVDNLEWVTQAENIRLGFKAGLFATTQNQTVLTDGCCNQMIFSSQAEAARFLGRNHGYVNNLVKRGRKLATAQDGTKYTVMVVKNESS